LPVFYQLFKIICILLVIKKLIDRKRYETFSCEIAEQIKNKAQNDENN